MNAAETSRLCTFYMLLIVACEAHKYRILATQNATF